MTLIRMLGWTLVDSFWEIALIGGVLVVLNVFTARAKANVRYGFALVALTACLAVPMATFVSMVHPNSVRQAQFTTLTPSTSASSPVSALRAPLLIDSASIASISDESLSSLELQVEPILPTLVTLWLFGLLVMSLRFLGGVLTIETLKRRSFKSVNPAWIELGESVARRMGVTRPVQLRVCEALDSPSVVGVLKSVILLPASLVTHLSLPQIEALLAHEIAHVKRYDYVVNLAQSVVETVLFYHPAVWWISARIRAEREHCCDDLAVQAVGDRATYAQALLGLEEIRVLPRLALAANGGALLSRIRRIVVGQPKGPARGSLVVALLLTVLAFSSLECSLAGISNPVNGKVVTQDGRPAAGALVFVQMFDLKADPQPYQMLVADASGAFQFDVGAHTGYTVCAYEPGEGLGLRGNDGGKNPMVQLRNGHGVRLRAVDPSGHPIPGLRIEPRMVVVQGMGFGPCQELNVRLSGVTDSQGYTTLPDMARSPMTFQIEGGPYAISNAGKFQPHPSPDALTTLVLSKGFSIHGSVSAQGHPAKGAKVMAASEGGYCEALTDSNGQFAMRDVFSGRVRLEVVASQTMGDDWVGAPHSVESKPGTALNVDLTLERGAEVSGVVVDSAGTPEPGLNIRFPGLAGTQTQSFYGITQHDGTFKALILPGTHRVSIYGKQLVSAKTFVVRADDEMSLKLVTMGRDNILHCAVTDGTGQPVWGTQIEVHCTRDGKDVVLGCVNDWLRVPVEDMNTVWGIAKSEDRRPLGRSVPVGNRLVVKVLPLKMASISGFVTDDIGRPVSGATISVSNSTTQIELDFGVEEPSFDLKSDAKGNFWFNDFRPGTKPKLTVRVPGYKPVELGPIELKAGENKVLTPIRLKPLN